MKAATNGKPTTETDCVFAYSPFSAVRNRIGTDEGIMRVKDALLVAELAAQRLHENDQLSAQDLRAACEALAGHLELTRLIAAQTDF